MSCARANRDGVRWDRFVPRPNDIVVSTSMKAGTTWTLGIVANLLWPDGELPAVLGELSPWLDSRFDSTGQVRELAKHLA